MHMVSHSEPRVFEYGGIHHQTLLSGPETRDCSLWLDTFVPEAETPLHYCTCEQVLTVLSGFGEVTEDGRTYEIGPETTVVFPAHVVHSFRARTPMRCLAVFVDPEPKILDPDGREIEIPWLSMAASH
jgi:quercetin dioxygenase-like cupin family protein